MSGLVYRWRPNPFHLAALVVGERGPPTAPPTRADPSGPFRALLEEAFRCPAELLLAPRPEELPTLLDLFDYEKVVGRQYDTAKAALEQALELCPAEWRRPLQRMCQQIRGQYARGLDRLVELLAPVTAAQFTERPVPDAIGYYEASNGPFVTAGAQYWEPVQGPWRNCWLIASMSAAAWSAAKAFDHTLSAVPTIGTATPFIRWRFKDKPGRRFRVETDLPKSPDGYKQPLHAYSAASSHELWPGMIEKAWAMREAGITSDINKKLPNVASYQQLVAPSHAPNVALKSLLGTTFNEFPPDRLLGRDDLCPAGQVAVAPMVASSKPSTEPAVGDNGLASNHAYSVLGVIETNGKRHLVLRDPHGTPYMSVPNNLPFASCTFTDGNGDAVQVVVNEHGVRVISESEFEKAFGSVSLPASA